MSNVGTAQCKGTCRVDLFRFQTPKHTLGPCEAFSVKPLSVLLIHVLICIFVINKVEDPSVKSLVTLKVKENSTVTG